MTKPYQAAISLTPAKQTAVDVWLECRERASPRIKLHGKRGDVTAVGTDHSDPAVGFAFLMEAVGTKEEAFLAGLMEHLINAGVTGQDVGQAGEAKANFLLSVVKGIEPKDEIEAMLAAQMAAVHSATITLARRLNHVDKLAQQDSAERAAGWFGRRLRSPASGEIDPASRGSDGAGRRQMTRSSRSGGSGRAKRHSSAGKGGFRP